MKYDMLPPDFDLQDYDEETTKKQYDEANKNPVDKISDHEDDKTAFEINIINKRNESLVIPCLLFQGEIHPQFVYNIRDDAINFSQMTTFQRNRLNEDLTGESFQSSYKIYGPKWMYLNENL